MRIRTGSQVEVWIQEAGSPVGADGQPGGGVDSRSGVAGGRVARRRGAVGQRPLVHPALARRQPGLGPHIEEERPPLPAAGTRQAGPRCRRHGRGVRRGRLPLEVRRGRARDRRWLQVPRKGRRRAQGPHRVVQPPPTPADAPQRRRLGPAPQGQSNCRPERDAVARQRRRQLQARTAGLQPDFAEEEPRRHARRQTSCQWPDIRGHPQEEAVCQGRTQTRSRGDRHTKSLPEQAGRD